MYLCVYIYIYISNIPLKDSSGACLEYVFMIRGGVCVCVCLRVHVCVCVCVCRLFAAVFVFLSSL